MATRTILFRGQTRRKGERTSISGIPLPGIWVAGGVFPQNKGYDYAIIYQQNPKVEKYVVHADTIGQYTGINDSLGNFIFEDDIITFWLKNDATRTRRKGVVEYSESSARFMVRVCESTDVVMLKDCCCILKAEKLSDMAVRLLDGVSRRDVVKDLEDFRDKWRHYNEQAAAESQVILDKISELFEKDGDSK